MSRSQLAKLSAQYSLGAGLESRYFEYSTDQEQDCQDCCKYHITEEPLSHFCFMMTSTFKTDVLFVIQIIASISTFLPNIHF